MDNYNPQKLEKKWQKYWENNKTNSCDLGDSKKPKFYNLAMFYYPSGAKIHIGHGYNYSGSDVFGRYKRLNGFNVLEPMGADAFGLPAENYAIKTRVHPARTTKENIDFGRGQLKELGLMYDWEKEINTSSPEYYKWTQWLFTILYKAGLAYRAKAPVNWCPSCKTVLANEQVITGKCERCETQVTQKNLKQWFFKITDYADRLLKDHSKLNWPKKTLLMQKNWISRKEWIDIDYKVKGTEKKVSVSTTRPDTNFGATFIVAAPEHPLLSKKENLIPLKYRQAVDKYIALSKKKTDEERIEEGKKKTGVFTGLYCINPLTKREMPLWVTDFVLMSVGTGAVVAVPGHDKRDFEFAQEFKLPVVRVVVGSDGDKSKITKKEQVQEQEGTMVNSDFLDGMNIHDATKKIMDYLEKRGWGKRTIRYRLRDWLISRQRYWGAPIPVIFCENCENRKLNYVLIHGFTGSSKRNFFPWLEKELKKQGHKVTNLNLPNPGKPSIKEQVDYVLKNTKINKDTVLLGHSLGGVVVMKLLEKINKKTAKVLLVDSFVKPEFTDHKRPNVKKSCDWKFDFEKIKKSADEIIILADSSFSVIPEKQSREMEGLLGAKLVLKNPKEGHFCNDVEPDVFEELKNSGESLVEEKDLPIKLPELKNFQPTSSGESPLARSKEFLNVKCPKCGSKAKRSTETMDTFVCSSWYFLRFISPKLKDKPFDKKIATKWLPVDQYCGGAEHATLHLLYARFITKVLKDQGYINFDEPFKKLNHQGMILAEDGSKMSKSKGNVVIPEDYIKKYGADVFRAYVLFLAPFEDGGAWNDKGIMGVKRFIDKVWELQQKIKKTKNQENKTDKNLERIIHQTIKKVTEDIENFHFNTAISALMILVNELTRQKQLSIINYQLSIILLSPFAPHLAEELWEALGNKKSIFNEKWPKYNPKLIKEDEIELVIQINGKVRDKVRVSANITEPVAKKKALESEKIKKWVKGTPKKVIFIKGKLINIVT